MTILDRPEVILGGDDSPLRRSLSGAQSALNGAGRNLEASAARIERSMSGSFSRTGQAAHNLGLGLQDVGRNLSTRLTLPIVALGAAAAVNATKIDSLRRGLDAVNESGRPTAEVLDRLRDVARLPGLGFEEAIRGSINLQAVGFSADEAERTLRAFGNAVATTGGGASELGRITTQLTQMASAGRILTADLRPIIQTSPLVAKALQDAFGTIDAQELEALGLTFDEFFDQLVTQLEQLPQFTGGAANSFENLGDSFNKATASFGERFLPVVMAGTGALADLLEFSAELDPAFQNLAIGFAAAAAALGPVSVAVGGILKVLPLLQANMAALVAVGGPVLLGVAAFGALTAAGLALVQNWGIIKFEVVQLVDLIRDNLVTRFTGIVGAIGEKVEEIKGFFADMFHAVVGGSFVPDMMDGIAREFARLVAEMVVPAEGATQAVTDAFARMSGNVRSALSGLGVLGRVLGFSIPGLGQVSGLFSAATTFSSFLGGGGSSNASETSGQALSDVAPASLSLSINVPPANDPITFARDGQWQRALHETLLNLEANGFAGTV